MHYRQTKQPGCGGCLVLLLIFIFLTGGASGLVDFIGVLLFSGMAAVLAFVAIFWGFTYWVQKKVATYEASQSETHNRFVWLMTNILVNIAKIDGIVTKEEIVTIQRFFQYNLHYSHTQMSWVKEQIKEAIDSTESMDSLLYEFKKSFDNGPRLILLELIYQIIYTKDPVPENELIIARNIADFFNISTYDRRSIEIKFKYKQDNQQYSSTARNTDSSKYYAILGLKPDSDMAAIKKAYRKLSMKYHPDKVGHLGEEFRKIAEEKMKEINIAYDYFKTH